MPRLPPLTWNGHFWTSTIAMPSWTGFQARGGAYGSRGKPTKGRIVRVGHADISFLSWVAQQDLDGKHDA